MEVRNKRIARVLGMFLFVVGLVLGVVLAAVIIWGHLEAVLFDPSLRGEGRVRLHCPAMLTSGESGIVWATFHNPLEREATFSVRTHVSEGHVTLMRQLDSLLPLDPGQRQRLEWEVSAGDAVYGLFVLVKVHLFGHYPLPARQGSCGILTLDVPFLSGGLLFTLVILVLFGCLAGGIALWHTGARPIREGEQDTPRAMAVLAALVIVDLLAGLLGWWTAGIVTVAITLLTIVVIALYRLERRRS